MAEAGDLNIDILEKPTGLKRAGFALIVVALVLLLLITTSSALYSPLVLLYSYGLIGVGAILIIANKVLEIRFRRQLRTARVYCLKCGWGGSGAEWYRYECCPECDAEEVIRV